jgi:flap endonuclease-1
MGIQGLMKLIGDYAPSALKENDIKTYFGAYASRGGILCLVKGLVQCE